MTTAHRIKQVCDNELIKITELEKKLGASKGVLSRAIRNNTDIQSKWISSLVENYPNYNPTWLLTGKGDMLLRGSEGSSKVEGTAVAYGKTQPTITEGKGVPYYDVDFIGGFDLVFNNQSITPSFYIDFSPFNDDADYWVNVSGDSMKPLISHGDIVALQKFEDWRDFVLYGEIYAIITSSFRTIKIMGKGTDKEHFGLIPYNKSEEFSSQDIPKRLIRHMFKVKGSIKKFF